MPRIDWDFQPARLSQASRTRRIDAVYDSGL